MVNIRNYLYHGINGANYDIKDTNYSYKNGDLYILESMLKTGYIVNYLECEKYNVRAKCNMYPEMGYSPRISLGFYPLDQATYLLSKKRHPNYYGENIIDKIIEEHNIGYDHIDEYVINSHNLNKSRTTDDWAWRYYYDGRITLILNKKILSNLKISDYGMLADEICIDDPINLREYLEYISLGDIAKLNRIINLLEVYQYNCPVIDFSTGQIIYDKPKIKNLENK